MAEGKQFLRRLNLLVSPSGGGEGLDLSRLRVRFVIKKTDSQTPNTIEVIVYNLEDGTAKTIRNEFDRLILQAGYEGNFGVIFDGTIKDVVTGREAGIDKTLAISAGDGDDAYNYAIVNATLASGSTQADQIAVAASAMAAKNIGNGYKDPTGAETLPRGKVLFGMARDVMRGAAESSDTSWSIQDGKLQFVKRTGLLPNQAVLLTPSTGLIDSPKKTDDGADIVALLNPLIKIGGSIKLRDTDLDGVYRVLTVEHSGDTRGPKWYTAMKCIAVDETAPDGEQVKPK